MTDRPDLSRRDFLKNVGMTGVTAGLLASVGMTAAGEIIQQTTAGDVQKRPWWVRPVDKPTTGVDWDRMQRFDTGRHVMAHGWLGYVGEAEATLIARQKAANEHERILGEVPGYTLKDYALQDAFISGRRVLPLTFQGPGAALTPAERDVPRWDGSPDDAAAMVKVAMRHMGAASVGVVHLDERTRKLIYAVDVDGKRIEFEDVDQPYETDDKRVIPYKAEWAIVFGIQMSGETLRRAPTALAQATTMQAYLRGLSIQITMQEFLRGLGYVGLGEASINALAIAPAFAVMGGLGELSRQNRVISPEYGPMIRFFVLITDLPLTNDRPIDAGIAQFCRTCKKCAEACPPGALSFDTEPTWQPCGAWNNAGHEAWFEDGVKCRRYWESEAGTNCGICFAVCPFSKQDRSFIHQFTKMHIANAPVLDGPIRSMDDAFGYGMQKDPAEWWHLDLPEYGIDTRHGK